MNYKQGTGIATLDQELRLGIPAGTAIGNCDEIATGDWETRLGIVKGKFENGYRK